MIEHLKQVTVIIPSLDPDEKLIHTVCGLTEIGFKDIVLVNDGSAPAHLHIFEQLEQMPEVTLLGYEVNKGKGYALKTAFDYCAKNRPDIAGVVTADGDGQHLAVDIKACALKMVELKNHVVLGVRDFYQKEAIMIEDGVEKPVAIPDKSRKGNLLTIKIFKLLCGIQISDTQTGLRAIPKEYLELLTQTTGNRFEYETQMLLDLHKKKIPVTEVKIKTVYIGGNEGTHFHPVRDSIKIYSKIFGHVIRFVLSSLSSSLVDFSIYSMLLFAIGEHLTRQYRLLIAVVAARIISSLFNFFMNKKVVFKSDAPIAQSMLRYYILCACIMLSSYGLTYGLCTLLNFGPTGETFIKIPVDCILFLVGFQVQNRWVYSER